MSEEFPDFLAMRKELAEFPDDMVHDNAQHVIRAHRTTNRELLWVIESYERRKPRVHKAVVAEGIQPTESLS